MSLCLLEMMKVGHGAEDACNIVAIFIAVVVLEFVQESYTFSETTPFSDAVISIMITNYDELVIQNDVIVNIIFQNDLDNATESEGK